MCSHLLLWCCCNKEGEGNKLLWPFFVSEKKNNGMTTRHRLLLWWCFSEEGNGSLLPSPSSLMVLKFNLVVFGCL
jgi:hypothetical protein